MLFSGYFFFFCSFQNYTLILESRDSENFYSATTTVVIYVTDENDNLPVFGKNEYVIENKVIEEDSSVSKENPMELITVSFFFFLNLLTLWILSGL